MDYLVDCKMCFMVDCDMFCSEVVLPVVALPRSSWIPEVRVPGPCAV